MFLLSEARRLALRGKALAEILAARAAYIPAIDEFEKKRQSITADTDADQNARDKAVADAAAEQSPAPDRRISVEAFEQIADAALAAGTPMPTPSGEALPPDIWLETLFANLVAHE